MANIKHNDLLTDMHINTIFGRVLEIEELHYVIKNSYNLFIEEYKRKLTTLTNESLSYISNGTRSIIRNSDAGTENYYIMGNETTDYWTYKAFRETHAPINLENLIPKMNNLIFKEREALVLGIVNNKYAVVYFESKESNPIIHTYKLTSLFGYGRPVSIALKRKRLDDFINDIVIKRNKEKKQNIKDTKLFINSLTNAVVNRNEEPLTFESLMRYVRHTQN